MRVVRALPSVPIQQPLAPLAPVLVGIDDESTVPKLGDLVVVYKFVMTVARLLKTQTSLALSEVVDELDNEFQLKQ
jgi:hypothetical protein